MKNYFLSLMITLLTFSYGTVLRAQDEIKLDESHSCENHKFYRKSAENFFEFTKQYPRHWIFHQYQETVQVSNCIFEAPGKENEYLTVCGLVVNLDERQKAQVPTRFYLKDEAPIPFHRVKKFSWKGLPVLPVCFVNVAQKK